MAIINNSYGTVNLLETSIKQQEEIDFLFNKVFGKCPAEAMADAGEAAPEDKPACIAFPIINDGVATGEWVVKLGDEVLGTYPTQDAAVEAAKQKTLTPEEPITADEDSGDTHVGTEPNPDAGDSFGA